MTDLQQTIEEMATTVMGYIKDAATLTVKTTGVAADGTETEIATTILKLDLDADYRIPVRQENGRLVIETDLLAAHERGVKSAADYRAQMLAAFIQAIGTLVKPAG